MDRLDRPARGDELVRQPVEELGVGGLFAEDPEVVARRDDTPAEMPLPNAVDRDAGRQRIVRTGDPTPELEAMGYLSNRRIL